MKFLASWGLACFLVISAFSDDISNTLVADHTDSGNKNSNSHSPMIDLIALLHAAVFGPIDTSDTSGIVNFIKQPAVQNEIFEPRSNSKAVELIKEEFDSEEQIQKQMTTTNTNSDEYFVEASTEGLIVATETPERNVVSNTKEVITTPGLPVSNTMMAKPPSIPNQEDDLKESSNQAAYNQDSLEPEVHSPFLLHGSNKERPDIPLNDEYSEVIEDAIDPIRKVVPNTVVSNKLTVLGGEDSPHGPPILYKGLLIAPREPISQTPSITDPSIAATDMQTEGAKTMPAHEEFSPSGSVIETEGSVVDTDDSERLAVEHKQDFQDKVLEFSPLQVEVSESTASDVKPSQVLPPASHGQITADANGDPSQIVAAANPFPEYPFNPYDSIYNSVIYQDLVSGYPTAEQYLPYDEYGHAGAPPSSEIQFKQPDDNHIPVYPPSPPLDQLPFKIPYDRQPHLPTKQLPQGGQQHEEGVIIYIPPGAVVPNIYLGKPVSSGNINSVHYKQPSPTAPFAYPILSTALFWSKNLGNWLIKLSGIGVLVLTAYKVYMRLLGYHTSPRKRRSARVNDYPDESQMHILDAIDTQFLK